MFRYRIILIWHLKLSTLGLQSLCSKYPNLQRLVVANCSEIGLLNVVEGCPTMQELVLHHCDDQVLRGIATFKNMQILKLVRTVGVAAVVCRWWWWDIGLTILAQGCKRLVKLELRGCK
ncbi:putative leucine-rich repeat domain superfamily [Helianthus annuus]|nr:putative leucine-rich repeat domain superfamily [Helianthus annuus]